MGSKYSWEWGDWHNALEWHSEHGGMLFPQRSNDSAITCVSGNRTHTFWPKNSPLRYQVLQLGKDLGYPDNLIEYLTGGRLAKWYMKEKLQIPHKGTYWGQKYRELAKKGFHWHYLHCLPGRYPAAMEIDLKSAYATALCHGDSFLLSEKFGYQDDGGALQRFRDDLDFLPKWFRLIILGILAQHEMKYFIKDKDSDSGELKLVTNQQISYGAAFNATHKAILRVYRVMKTIHDFFGSDCIRIHTDGFVVNLTPESYEKLELYAIDYLQQVGFEWSVKACGTAWLHDIGLGFIGRKIMGNRFDLRDRMRENDIKIPEEQPEVNPPQKLLNAIKEDPKQIELLNLAF